MAQLTTVKESLKNYFEVKKSEERATSEVEDLGAEMDIISDKISGLHFNLEKSKTNLANVRKEEDDLDLKKTGLRDSFNKIFENGDTSFRNNTSNNNNVTTESNFYQPQQHAQSERYTYEGSN